MGNKILEENQRILETVWGRVGIDMVKVQKVAAGYLQIARDNQLNYNELLQVFSIVKESVLQSLNRLSISDLPAITSEAANE